MQEIKASFHKHSFIVTLLFVIVLFLPVNYFSSVNMDDIGLLQWLQNTHANFNIPDLFFRDAATKYYRPLLSVIYYIDYSIWGMAARGYHFGNYLIHILNACLVYLIAFHFVKKNENARFYSSLAMLLFALNPLTCESVAWISGRSDLAGTFFSLVAFYIYIQKFKLKFFFTPLFILTGLLCKENTLSVIPIIILTEFYTNYCNGKRFGQNIQSCFYWTLIVLIPLIVYLFLRTNGWEHYSYKYVGALAPYASHGKAEKNMVLSRIFYVLPVVAFYIKKLIIPYPLNFAISQLNTSLYSFLFCLLLFLNVISLIKKKFSFVFFNLLLVASFTPALLVVLGDIAWVPLAERYLYLTLTVFAVGATLLVKHIEEKHVINRKAIISFCCIIILILSISTLDRIFVWKDSKSLWSDTLKKNPENSMVLFKYGQAMGEDEREWAYRKALAVSDNFKWRALALFEIAKFEKDAGNYDQSITNFDSALRLRGTFDTYYSAAHIISDIGFKNFENRNKYFSKAIELYKLAYSKRKKPVVLYKAAVLLNKSGKKREAKELLLRIVENHPASLYALHSKRIIDQN